MTTFLQRVQSALAPRYLVRRELGTGGMAVVFLAEDSRHGRSVAVKVLRAELAAALGPERFLLEIRIAAGLRHPHIVPLFDSGEADGLLYYVMPYVEGESLRDRLRRERQLPVDEALGIAREVADALAHAHEHDLIHRDIKPENILLEGGHALVADFGIARAVGSAATQFRTATGLAIGTPAYMSPEQAMGDAAVDVRSDVYALGCVLYEMLVGEPPYTGPTPQAILARRLSDPVRPLRTVRAAVPDHLERAVMRALARVPADRFRNVAAFRDAFVNGPAADRSDRAGTEPRPRVPRRLTLLAAAAAVTVVLIVAAIALPRRARLRGGSPPAVGSGAVPGVAVLPFRTTDADPELWHEGIVDLLSYNLDGLGQLRKIDPVTVLTGWRRMGGSASHALTAAEAREVGRRLGGRYVITGRAVQVGGDVQLIAEVQDVESGGMRGAARVTRPADSASSLVDGLTLELLRRNLLPTDGEYSLPNLSRATTASLPALKEYLAGEREYRTAQWSEAARHYHRAIEADSNFASAWLRLAATCGWGACPSQPGEDYHRRAQALADQLPDRDAKRLRAANDVQALEAFTATYPDDLEGWIALGESYFHHYGGSMLRPNDSYRGAFTRAVQLHPYNAEAYTHLIEDAFLRLDSLDAQRLIDGYAVLGATKACTGDQVSYDLVWGTAAARARAFSVLDTMPPIECLVQAPPAAPPEALDRLAQKYARLADTVTPAGVRTFALARLLQVRVPNGQITAARRALARMADLPIIDKSAARWEIQLHLSGFPDSAGARRAVRVLAAQAAPTDYFWIGALAVSEGRWTDVATVRRALGRQLRSVEPGGEPPGANARAYAAVLGPYMELVKGDSTRPSEFESALVRLPVFGNEILQPQMYLRYQVGRLLFDRGRMDDAERYFRSFMPYDFFYTSPAELYLGRIAEVRGRRDEAVLHYGRFVRWWRHADEPLRPQWEEARQSLSRLAGE
jgi:serine/threonine-protein kinase